MIHCPRYGGGGEDVVPGPAGGPHHASPGGAWGAALLPGLPRYLCHVPAGSRGGSSLCCLRCTVTAASQVHVILRERDRERERERKRERERES